MPRDRHAALRRLLTAFRLRAFAAAAPLAAAMATAMFAHPAAAAEFEKFDSPLTHYSIVDAAVTRCGPDESMYETGEVGYGQGVEVYGHVGERWLAIRPPAEQYSWLVARHAHLLPGGKVAEVTDAATPAWINGDGVELSQFNWQIKLEPSQQVNVRGHFSQPLEVGKSQAWYKIDPPPGEFRWVLADEFSADPPKPRRKPAAAEASTRRSTTPSGSPAADANVRPAASLVHLQGATVELGPGEFIVDGSHGGEEILPEPMGAPELWTGGVPVEGVVGGEVLDGEWMDSEVVEGSVLVDGGAFVDGGVVVDGGFVDGGAACDSCGPTVIEPDRRVRPLAGVLGLVGLGIVVADREPLRCGGCGIGGCEDCSAAGMRGPVPGAGFPSPATGIGGLPSRLDSLPRPTRSIPPSEADRSLLIDRVGAARRRLRDSIEATREHIEGGADAREAKDSASVALGLPTDGGGWQGLPRRGVPSSDPQLDVQMPSRTAESPSDSSMRQTSAPGPLDQSSWEPLDSQSDEDFSDAALRNAAAELTAMIAMPTEQWQLQGLRSRVEDVIEAGGSPIARGEARLLLERIEQFDSFRLRWLQANGRQVAVAPANPYLAAASSAVSPVSFQRAVDGGSGARAGTDQSLLQSADATGWLVAVKSQRDDFPKYALTDDAGHLVAYVDLAPGLNAGVYLDQPVAVFGQRGMNALLNMRSIRADRIVRVSQ